MNLPKFNIFRPIGAQFKREIAHFSHQREVPCFCSSCLCNMNSSEQDPSKDYAPYCQHRYPSPGWPINNLGRSARGNSVFAYTAAIVRRVRHRVLEVFAYSSDSFRDETNWESIKLCAKTHSSFWQSQHLDCLGASSWITMQSVPWPVRARVVLQARCLTTIASLVRLPVGLLAPWLTTSNLNIRAKKKARIDFMENAAGATLRLAFLRLKDTAHV